MHEKELNWNNNMCLHFHNEVKISFEILFFYSFDKKKFWIFQDLNQGPLDLKLLTFPLDHEASSEDRKKTSKVIVQSNQVMAGDSKIQKL